MNLGLYLHIPFCQAICNYCNFNRGLLDDELKVRYVDALEQEIRRAPGGHADTIFFGGGTPSLLAPEEIGRLIQACRETFDVAADAEVTLETNPETATPERLTAFREAGINRLSFGVQSFDDDELKRLGRIHSSARAVEAIRAAQGTGFASVSFDLMLWLPAQSRESWQRTIDSAVALEPDHLSLYLLELYPNAPLKEEMARAGWSQAPDDDAAEMYLEALARLDAAGLAQYEISNVARPGHRSRHNLKYWQAGDWFGFGCGAHSTVAGRRWKNLSSTTDYVARITAGQTVAGDTESLSGQARLEEALFTGLRLTEGIDCVEFGARFGVDPWERYGADLAPFVQSQRVWQKAGRFGLTREGMLVANEVFQVFV
ncbi:MAG: radical SAM family heme chaperone HemW [Acidobacteria bacterium]|nr:radical SAM family heme chaperone HemW [Acidobacteriota bacterium]